MWAGLLRPGEALSATREDLLLPTDGDKTMPFGLLSIKDPKTRYTNARHQSTKIDMPDMLKLKVIELFFGTPKPHQKLWPFSGNTLRSSFRSVFASAQTAFGTNQWCQTFRAGFNQSWVGYLADAGGWKWKFPTATGALGKSKDDGHVCPRSYGAGVSAESTSRNKTSGILQVANSFQQVLFRAEALICARIPLSAWHVLFQV